MHFDELLSQVDSSQSQQPLQIPENWTQGRTAFGGLSAALTYQAVKQQAGERPLRSLAINFVAPIASQQDISFTVEKLREGKSASQFIGRAKQQAQTTLLVQACFAQNRQSKITVPNTLQHQMPAPTKGKFIPQIPKVTPKFLRHFDLAIDSGSIPFTGSKHSHYHGWMRFKQPAKTLTDAHIIALIDAWPPTVIQKLRWPAPASTMTWSIDFIHPHPPLGGDSWLAYKVDTRQAADGYAHTEASVWAPSGDLIALSRQLVGVFD